MRLYYCTPLECGRMALEGRRLKISRIAELNDPYELLGLRITDEAQRRRYEEYVKELGRSRGIICLSREWSVPIMWSHYADRHRGVCLGFDVADENVFSVIYSDARASFDPQTLAGPNAREAIERLISTKHSAWAYEREARLWCSLSDEEGGMFFERFDAQFVLREVMLGVRADVAALPDFRSLAGSDVSVTQVRLSTDSFEVIRD